MKKNFTNFAYSLFALLFFIGINGAFAQTPIACDGDISASIGAVGEVDQYTFQGQAGERVIIRMKGDQFSLDAKLELFGPTGTMLASNASTSSGVARIGSPTFTLPVSGNFTILASDNGNNDVEGYGISFQIIKQSCAQPIGCDGDLSADIGKSAEMDAYYFEGTAGEKLIARMKGDQFSLDAALELYDPDGQQVEANASTSSGLARLGSPVVNLSKTGTYILLAMDNTGDDEEGYGLSMQFLKQSCAQPIGCDGDLSADIGKSAEMDAYYFEGTAGEKLIARMKGDQFSLDAALELYDPDGQQVEANASTSSGLARLGSPVVNLSKTGTYILLAMDNTGDDEEGYGLSMQFLKQSCAQPIGCDGDLSADIGKSAEMDAYYFEGTAGEKLIARMKGDQFSLDAALELYDPDGQQVEANASTSSGLARLGSPVVNLSKTGTYILLAMDNTGDDEEGYGLSMQFLKQSCAQPIGCDGDLGADIGKSAEMDAYYFEGTAGEKLIARMKGDQFSLDAALELYGPDGQQLTSNTNTNSSLARLGSPVVNLTQTGTYILLAMDNGGDDEEGYGASLQVLKPSCAQLVECVGNFTGNIGKSAEMDAFYFDAESCNSMQLIFTSSSFSFNETLTLYSGAGDFIASNTASSSNSAILNAALNYDDFIIVVEENEGNNTGDYSLSLVCLSPTLTSSAGTVSINALGGNQSFEVATDCPDWSIMGGCPWFTLTPTNGNGTATVAVNFQPNPTSVARSCSVMLEGCCHSVPISISQAGATLAASPTSLSISNDGETLGLNVNSTCIAWTLIVPGTAPWISPDTVSGTGSQLINLTFEPNCSGTARTTTLTLSGCGLTVNVPVTQAPSTLDASPTFLNLGVPAGQATVNVTSNCNAWAVTDTISWLTVTPTSGSNNGSLAISYGKNSSPISRTGTLTLTGCCLTENITVTQAAATLNVSPTFINAGQAAGQVTFSVSGTCCEWSVSSSESWPTISPEIGTQPGTVTINYGANTSQSTRTATITVTGCGMSRTIVLSQAGQATVIITASPSAFSFEQNSGLATLTISSNCSDWSVSENVPWLVVSPDEGSLNGTVTVFYDENPDCESREATITITGCGVTDTVEVEQAGEAVLSLSQTSQPVGAGAGSTSFTVTSNCNWTVSDDATWVSTSISGNTVTVNYDANTDSQSRTAKVTITCCGEVAEFILTQQGNGGGPTTTTASPDFTLVGNDAGQGTFEVFSNCSDWEIEVSANWLVVDPAEGGFDETIIFYYDENTGTAPRTASITITGCGVSYTIVVQQDGVNAVGERQSIADLAVFPNPASSFINVEVSDGLPPCLLRLCDARGQLIKQVPAQNCKLLTVETIGLPSGLCLLQLVAEDGRLVAVGRVVIIL